MNLQQKDELHLDTREAAATSTIQTAVCEESP